MATNIDKLMPIFKVAKIGSIIRLNNGVTLQVKPITKNMGFICDHCYFNLKGEYEFLNGKCIQCCDSHFTDRNCIFKVVSEYTISSANKSIYKSNPLLDLSYIYKKMQNLKSRICISII